MAKKAADVRPKITLACTPVQGAQLHHQEEPARNDPDRMELKKFCPKCHAHTAHRETR